MKLSNVTIQDLNEDEIMYSLFEKYCVLLKRFANHYFLFQSVNISDFASIVKVSNLDNKKSQIPTNQ